MGGGLCQGVRDVQEEVEEEVEEEEEEGEEEEELGPVDPTGKSGKGLGEEG